MCYSTSMNAVRTLFLAVVLSLTLPGVSQAQIPYQEAVNPTVPSGLVDIVVEADTYTPAFYAGRAEPVPGGPIRLIALMRDSGSSSPDSLLYYWTVDGQIVNFGEPSDPAINLLAPNKNEFTVRLRVTAESGETVAERSEVVSLSKPFLIFYEVNPLRGPSPIAISDTLYVAAEETTVEAAPYFIDVLNNPAYLEWSVNNVPVTVSGDNVYQLVLARAGLVASPAIVSFYAASRSSLGLTVEDKFTAAEGL